VNDSDKVLRQTVRSTLATFDLSKLRKVSLLLELGQVAEKVETQNASRDAQKKSVTAKRKNRAARNRKIRKFDADKRETNPDYSIAQLSRDLKKVRGKFYYELRLGGKFPSDEMLRRIARARRSFRRKNLENTPERVLRPGLS
jgi:hypothetical protein